MGKVTLCYKISPNSKTKKKFLKISAKSFSGCSIWAFILVSFNLWDFAVDSYSATCEAKKQLSNF